MSFTQDGTIMKWAALALKHSLSITLRLKAPAPAPAIGAWVPGLRARLRVSCRWRDGPGGNEWLLTQS